ncbi:MAG: hypothetical protein MK299_11490, partial [Pseudomonadales bacterium]|nr:hypothetical protein [Pseudomonadales bacterium]
YRCNFAVTSRKAPAFLQGLLQFELRLVGGGGLEPPAPACKLCNYCFSLSQVNHSPEFDGNLGSP